MEKFHCEKGRFNQIKFWKIHLALDRFWGQKHFDMGFKNILTPPYDISPSGELSIRCERIRFEILWIIHRYRVQDDAIDLGVAIPESQFQGFRLNFNSLSWYRANGLCGPGWVESIIVYLLDAKWRIDEKF